MGTHRVFYLLAAGISGLHFACRQAKLNFLCLIAVCFGAARILRGPSGTCVVLAWSGDRARCSHTQGCGHVPHHRASSRPSPLHPHPRVLGRSPRTHCFPSFVSFSLCQYLPCFGHHGNRWNTIPIFARCLCHPAQHTHCLVLFCVCFMLPSLKSDALGRGLRTGSGADQPLRQLSGVSPLCVYARVCACVSLSALGRCANKSSLCQNRQGRKKKENSQIGLQGSSALERDILVFFLWNFLAYAFPDFCQHN